MRAAHKVSNRNHERWRGRFGIVWTGTSPCAEDFRNIYHSHPARVSSKNARLVGTKRIRTLSLQLNPLHLKVNSLLNGRLFRIPDYQRAYSWTKKQRNDLFDDIKETHRSGREHFMATVVALARGTREIAADEFRVVELVDGQQRVTTLIILLKAIAKNLSKQDPSQSKIQREMGELLVKSDEHSLILLQTNHDSSNIFSKYIRDGVIDTAATSTAADKNIIDAALECEKFVQEWQKNSSLVELTSVVRNKLSMIYHEISDEATVYRVFEVLNSRGLDVKWIDKLKSQLMALIFEHVELGSRSETLHEMRTAWQKIYQILGLDSRLGDEALRFCGTWSLADRPNRILSEENASDTLTKAAGVEVKSIIKVAEDLKDVVHAVKTLDGNARLKAVTRIVHARFVAVAILLRRFPKDQESTLLAQWEKVTFKIFGLVGADTRYKVGDYVRLGYDILNNKITYKAAIDTLDGFGDDWDLNEVFARRDYWSDCYTNWSEEFRYMMYRYDEYLSALSGEKLNKTQWEKIWAEDTSKSIEHIKPQSSGEEYVHHLGNLTMLPPGVNSSLKDKPPKQKAEKYKNVGLRATADVGNIIEAGTGWDKKAIFARAKIIESFALSEWG